MSNSQLPLEERHQKLFKLLEKSLNYHVNLLSNTQGRRLVVFEEDPTVNLKGFNHADLADPLGRAFEKNLVCDLIRMESDLPNFSGVEFARIEDRDGHLVLASFYDSEGKRVEVGQGVHYPADVKMEAFGNAATEEDGEWFLLVSFVRQLRDRFLTEFNL